MAEFLLGDFRIQRPRYQADHTASVRWLSSAHAKSEAVLRGPGFDEAPFRRSMERHVSRFGCGPESLARAATIWRTTPTWTGRACASSTWTGIRAARA